MPTPRPRIFSREFKEAAVQRIAAGERVRAVATELKIAGGMSMGEAADQRREINRINAESRDRFRLLQGVEATSPLMAHWISVLMRPPRSNSCWPPRTHCCENVTTRPIGPRPRFRILRFGSWAILGRALRAPAPGW